MTTTKTLRQAVGVLATLLASSAFGLSPDLPSQTTEVKFNKSDSYADAFVGTMKTDKTQQRVLDEVRKTFVKNSKKYLPDGYALKVVVDNIDLAGDQSPLTSEFGEYRVLKDVYPPRIAFTYQIIDTKDQVVKSGSENLSDMNYRNDLKVAGRYSDSPAPYVKALVDRWSANTLKRL